MTFEQLVQRAKEIRAKYAALEKETYGAEWTAEEIMLGFQGDVGDLSKLAIAAEGKRNLKGVDDVKNALGHELADCLWSIIVLADKHDVDLESAFTSTMDDLDKRFTEGNA